MSEKKEPTQSHPVPERRFSRLRQPAWSPIRWLRDNILPTPHYLKDEKVQLKIMMASYRRSFPLNTVRVAGVILIVALIALIILLTLAETVRPLPAASPLGTPTAVLEVTGAPAPPTPVPAEDPAVKAREELFQSYQRKIYLAWAFIIIAGILVYKSLDDLLQYYQWQFILTNKRIIIMAPDLRQRGFTDTIYLKGGRIQVVDTNWSKSAYWGFFQALTGARDVNLSMGGYEFKEGGAEVKGGLRFPDVSEEDIKLLEDIIFG